MSRQTIGTAASLLVLIGMAFLLSASTVAAQQAHPVEVRGIVKAGDECPPPPGGPLVPQFRDGDVVSICFSESLPGVGPSDITVGQMHAMVGESTPTSLLVALPQEPSAGNYVLTGTANGAPVSPFLIRFFPTSKPRLTDLSPTSTSRGLPVRINGEGLSAPLDKISVSFGGEKADVNDVAPDGSWVVATLPRTSSDTMGGPKPVQVSTWAVPAVPPTGGLSVTFTQSVNPGLTAAIIGVALVPLLLVGGLVAWLFWSRKLGEDKPRNVLAGLLYDDVTQTYSLSRAQFLWWLAIIAFAYSFLFVGRGLTAGSWTFPPLNGLIYTLLISTSTLLLATATGNLRGQKGSGAVHPAPSDLIMHGGVIAPERVQQVLWTFLAGIALLWIVLSTYATATTLPEIPSELLALMGLSSAAYVGGKLVRSPGPIIRQVDADPGASPVQLVVSGENLDRDATVLVNGSLLPRTNINVEPVASSPGSQSVAATSQQLVPKLRLTTAITAADWAKGHKGIVIVNSDGQRSEWPATDLAASASIATAAAMATSTDGALAQPAPATTPTQ